MKVLIAGGTGTLGSELVEEIINSGHDVRILSRRPQPQDGRDEIEWAQADLAKREGIDQALRGINVVVHAATSTGLRAKSVDVEGTRRLLSASKLAGVEHFVYPSIVGIDDIPFIYYKYKLEAEQMIKNSDIPHTILRATQFHSLVEQLISGAMRLPIAALLPVRFKFQTVAASEVARRLNKCLDDGPSGRLPDFCGPEVFSLKEMTRIWLNAYRKQKMIIRLPIPGKTARAYRDGKATNPSRITGSMTWKEWLR